MRPDTSCWTCAYRRCKPTYFLGECYYFEALGKPVKMIPCSVVDVGCKFWKAKT